MNWGYECQDCGHAKGDHGRCPYRCEFPGCDCQDFRGDDGVFDSRDAKPSGTSTNVPCPNCTRAEFVPLPGDGFISTEDLVRPFLDEIYRGLGIPEEMLCYLK